MVRTERVQILVHEALNACAMIDHTDAEMVSAAFTLTLDIINTVKERAPSQLPVLKLAAEALLLACADETKKH